jgi:hypothetical protein
MRKSNSRDTNCRNPEGCREWRCGCRSAADARRQQSDVLQMAEQVRRRDGVGREAAARARGREREGETDVLMGHASVDTTLNVYTQLLNGSVRDAVEKIGGDLFTIVHRPDQAVAVSCWKCWCALQDSNLRPPGS